MNLRTCDSWYNIIIISVTLRQTHKSFHSHGPTTVFDNIIIFTQSLLIAVNLLVSVVKGFFFFMAYYGIEKVLRQFHVIPIDKLATDLSNQITLNGLTVNCRWNQGSLVQVQPDC